MQVEECSKALTPNGSETPEDSWLKKSLEKSEEIDPDFDPNQKDSDGDDDEPLLYRASKIPYNFKKDRVLFVYESQLKKLMKTCMKCDETVIKHEVSELQGTQYNVKMECLNGCLTTWSSQPKAKSLKGIGNLMVTSAIELSGISYPKFKRFAHALNLKIMEKTTFFDLRGKHLFPEVHETWKEHRGNLVEEVNSRGKPVSISVDGQCDSPGYNATYCTVTSMDVDTNKILDFKVECKNSQGMEKEGFIRSIVQLVEELIDLAVISTDRHTQIKKLMATDPLFNWLIHQFDPWHMAKGLSKKIIKASKKKGYEKLADWATMIVNHLYWAAQNCNQNGEELAERFNSVIHRIVDRHEFPGNHCTSCPPHDKSHQYDWLKAGSKPHEALKKIIFNAEFQKDLRKLNLNVFTTHLEVFHALKIRYLPKSIFYEQDKMECGMMLAALDHNLNINREQKQTLKEGKLVRRFKIAYHKYSKRFVAKQVKKDKSYDFLRDIAVRCHHTVAAGNRKFTTKRKRLYVTPAERPAREETIERSTKFSRMAVKDNQ
ncbi:uncharacterized protein [Clytia hemisphaerica]|uniref:uncharacterized protein n=1 Tax=Clytia hemisphaerica TaxID=252671 RepID=UPI0034D7067A